MIIWITGDRGAGKTTLAKQMRDLMPGTIILDGDEMRASISVGLGFSDEDRLENNLRIARLARILEAQGFPVLVATICPERVRQEVFYIAKCRFIHLRGSADG